MVGLQFLWVACLSLDGDNAKGEQHVKKTLRLLILAKKYAHVKG